MAAKKQTKEQIKKEPGIIGRVLQNPAVWSLLVKVGLGALFFIIGFTIANNKFFNDNPIFQVRFLAEALIGVALGVFGYHTVPIIALKIRDWFEIFVAREIEKIVSGFWTEQSKRMSSARRERDKRKKTDQDKKNKELLKSSVLLDTSVLVDGRLLDVVKTGFIDFNIVVPTSVMDELHLISDSRDDLKRARGRRGLDMLNDLKKLKKIRIFKAIGDTSKEVGVDNELIRLAKKYKMKIMTLDFNLNKVATARNIEVLNVNELANAIKTNVLPGEKLKVKIVQKGKEKGQGVGYLPDGTMIVVEGAEGSKGKKISVLVTRIIQKEAGRMVFCEV